MSLISPGAALITVSDVRLMQEVTIEEEPAVQMLINSVQSLFESLTHRLWGYRHDYEKIYNFDTARKRSKPKMGAVDANQHEWLNSSNHCDRLELW